MFWKLAGFILGNPKLVQGTGVARLPRDIPAGSDLPRSNAHKGWIWVVPVT